LVLQSIREFHTSILDDYMHLLVPILLRLIATLDKKLGLESVATIKVIKDCPSFREHSASIIH
jgi:hypothetical protein